MYAPGAQIHPFMVILPFFHKTNLALPTNILLFQKTLYFFEILWYNIKNNG